MRPSVRTIRLCLWLSAVVCGSGAVISISSAIILPCEIAVPGPQTRPTTRLFGQVTKRRVTSGEELDAIPSFELRRPLFDPPPAIVTAPVVPMAPLVLKVSGTMVEPGHSMAVVVGADGKPQIRRVGERIGGAELRSIDEEGVMVEYNGNVIRIKVTKG